MANCNFVGSARIATTYKITRMESTKTNSKLKYMLAPHIQETLLDIHNFQIANGWMPTITELVRVTRCNPKSSGCVQSRIAQLVEAGYLVRGEKGSARAMQFGKHIDVLNGKIPVLGTCN
jgi:hypothetical protein